MSPYVLPEDMFVFTGWGHPVGQLCYVVKVIDAYVRFIYLFHDHFTCLFFTFVGYISRVYGMENDMYVVSLV